MTVKAILRERRFQATRAPYNLDEHTEVEVLIPGTGDNRC